MAGRTTFVIAQRLRTLKQADTILVLEAGRIVQHGTHDALLAQPGLYRRIYDLQLRDQEDFGLDATRNGHPQQVNSMTPPGVPQGPTP
jgi:ABC-type cobalamin transport system ATPase subunit